MSKNISLQSIIVNHLAVVTGKSDNDDAFMHLVDLNEFTIREPGIYGVDYTYNINRNNLSKLLFSEINTSKIDQEIIDNILRDRESILSSITDEEIDEQFGDYNGESVYDCPFITASFGVENITINIAVPNIAYDKTIA